MKAFIVYQDTNWGSDKHAMLVSEDGRILADHICSNESFMPGDLWTEREQRQKEFQEKGIELEVDLKPRHIENFKNTHPEVFHKTFEETPNPAERGE